MFSQLRGWELPAIAIIALLLFGGKKLPEAARGLGRSLRILKAETKGLNTDETTDAPADKPAEAPVDRTEA
ncbi:MAG: hypothetical protein RL205_1370 [Actinomycetota bacterium]|jgi:sec-independent protein translocase protein TatA